MIELRRATPDDAADIAAIYAPAITDGWASFEGSPPDAAEMERRIEAAGDAYPWFLAEDDHGPSGFIYAGPHRTRAAYQTSVDTSIYLADRAQGRGYGKRMYTAMLRCLTEQNYVMAFAGIALPNAASIALHTAVGFKEVARYPNVGFKHGAWRDTVWLGCPLAPPQIPPAHLRTLDDIDLAAILA